ncbi:MAG: hypothetical protein AB7H90_18485 [Alphaproteobacteria bacterium]
MEGADYFRHKAAQCRRLAAAIVNQHDPAVARLMALAVEFDARAAALTAEETGAARSDRLPSAPDRDGRHPERECCISR